MSKNTKPYLLAFIFWAINIKLFLLISNWDQISLMFKYSQGFWDFYVSVLKFYLQFVTTIPVLTLLLSLVFTILLGIFWVYYFKIYFHKLPTADTRKTGIWGILASVFTFLGFGCVACGQTLLTSILLLFVSNTTSFFAESVGNFSIVIGITLLSFGIYRNYKIYHDKNICKI